MSKHAVVTTLPNLHLGGADREDMCVLLRDQDDPRDNGVYRLVRVPVDGLDATDHDFSDAWARWSRAQIQAYLEGRGFAVYDDESTGDLREAARLDMEEASESDG